VFRRLTDRLIARCAYLACKGRPVREAESLIWQALVYLALAGTDTRKIAALIRDQLLSEGRLRLADQSILILYQGEDLNQLQDEIARMAERIKIDLYAALIGHSNEDIAGACERRSLTLLNLADRMIAEQMQPLSATVLKAAFLNELDLLLEREAVVAVRDVTDRIDHFYSQFVLLRMRTLYPQAPKQPTAHDINWTKLENGLRHGVLAGQYRFGPLRANLLEISPKRWRLKVVAGHDLPPEERTLRAMAARHGARYGTNGGFYLLAEHEQVSPARFGEPIGLLVSEGRVLNPPTIKRSALLMDETGRIDIWRLGSIGLKLRIGRARIHAHKINSDTVQPGEIVLYTSSYGKELPRAPLQIAIVGRRVVDVAAANSLNVPVNGLLLAINNGPAPLGELASIEPNHEVAYELPPMRGLGSNVSAVAGGPALLTDGQRDGDLEADSFDGLLPPTTFSPFTRAATSLLPRTAWGITADYRLIAITVDGRNLTESVGLDLDSLARLLADLGCVSAVNMDGGASARMLVGGQLVDRGSVDIVLNGEAARPPRPMSSAILLVER